MFFDFTDYDVISPIEKNDFTDLSRGQSV